MPLTCPLTMQNQVKESQAHWQIPTSQWQNLGITTLISWYSYLAIPMRPWSWDETTALADTGSKICPILYSNRVEAPPTEEFDRGCVVPQGDKGCFDTIKGICRG